MALGPPGYVSIVEIIVYLPAFIAGVVVTSRHGVHRASGWIYTLILCTIRIAGAVCQLLTYHDTSEGLLKATLIIDSIGISPLLLATLGILSRLYVTLPKFFHAGLTHTAALIGSILVGSRSSA